MSRAFRISSTASLLLLTGLSIGSMSCKQVAEAVRPDEASAGEAIGEDGGRCKEGDRDGEANPFIVDWTDTDRGALEAAMKNGVAVVSYTCEGVKVLRGCHLDGDYAYTGISRKEKVVQMKDQSSLEANLSGASANIPAEIKAGIGGGRALNLAYSVIGMDSTSVYEVSSAQLEGRCDGATHFVFGTSRGAFAMKTAAAGEVYAAAEVFKVGGASASSSAGKETAIVDGRLDACQGSSSKDTETVEGCEALVRLELAPINQDGAAAKKAPDATQLVGQKSVRGCPEGFIMADDICVEEAEAKAENLAHLCEPNDYADCADQCEAGDFGSCGRLSKMIILNYEDWDAFDNPFAKHKDDMDARLLTWVPKLKQACDAGEANACTAAVSADTWSSASGNDGIPMTERIDLLEKGCGGGEPWACDSLGYYRMPARSKEVGSSGHPNLADPEGWLALTKQSCDRGSGLSCAFYGWALAGLYGEFAPNIASASAALERGCYGGIPEACMSVAGLNMEQAACTAMFNDMFILSLKAPLKWEEKICKVPGKSPNATKASEYKTMACEKGLDC